MRGNAFYQVAVGKNGWIWALGEVIRDRRIYVNRLDGLGFVINNSIISSISIADDYLFGVNDNNALFTGPYNCTATQAFTLPHGCFIPTATTIVGTPNSDGNRSNVAGNDDGQVFILNTSGHIYQEDTKLTKS